MNISETLRGSPLAWRLLGFMPAWKSIQHIAKWPQFLGMDEKLIKRRVYHFVRHPPYPPCPPRPFHLVFHVCPFTGITSFSQA